jgi:cobalt-precorrin-5B (C1)-methyltransferase
MPDQITVDDAAAPTPMRRGWTTGTCATVAAVAAYQALLGGAFADRVTVRLPRGGTASLAVVRLAVDGDRATASVIKDAGDDPDVTHGAEVVVTVERAPSGSGLVFRGGEGVGTVTLPGLPVAVGEPAINPVPRGMIRDALAAVADAHDTTLDAIVTIAIPGGAELALKTLNGRLGIQGGLSILGTTGVVVPFSCAAWIHSIHRGIDVARAAGLTHLALATGSVSEQTVQRLYALPDAALIDMGDFAVGTLKYLARHPVARITVAGGFGKLTKMAQGRPFLHSSASRVDIGDLAERLAACGAPPPLVDSARQALSAAQVLALARAEGIALADRVAAGARDVAAARLSADTSIDVVIVDRAGKIVGRA